MSRGAYDVPRPAEVTLPGPSQCVGLDMFDVDTMMSACAGCGNVAACRQLAANFGETAGVWGGLDLSDREQRKLLPAKVLAHREVPVVRSRRGRPDTWEGVALDPTAVNHGTHTRAKKAEY